MSIAFAIAVPADDAPDGYWFVSRSSTRAHVIRTSSQFAAMPFTKIGEAQLWFSELHPTEKDRLADLGAIVVDLEIRVGGIHASPWLVAAPKLTEQTKLAAPTPSKPAPSRRRSA